MFFPALHTLRGLAALWVLVMHAWARSGEPNLDPLPGLPLTTAIAVGWIGVHLFYALSGFLLAYGELSRSPENRNYGRFIGRRLLRIFPAYYVQLGVLLLIGHQIGIQRTLSLRQVVEHLVMYFNLPPDFLVQLNGVWWTLPVEFHFYLLLPLLAPLAARIGAGWFWLGCAVVETAFRYMVFSVEPGWPVPKLSNVINQLPGVISIFGAGVALAHLTVNRGWRPKRPRLAGSFSMLAWCGWIGVLLAWAGEYWGGHPLLFTWTIGSGLGAALLVWSLHGLEPGSGWMTHPVPVWLGDISYGVYLWHLPVMSALNTFWLGGMTGPAHFLALFGTGLGVTIAIAALSFYLVEKPAMRLGRHWSRLRRSDPQAW